MRLFVLSPRIRLLGGFRLGAAFRPQDFTGLFNQRAHAAPIEGSFLYVIQGTHGLVKVGVTKDPNGRLASLQTGSPFPLSFAYIGATPGEGYDIEANTHLALRNSRVNGEWFSVPPLRAIEALHAQAAILGHPLLQTSPELVERILAVAGATTSPPPLPHHGAPNWVWWASGFLFLVLWAMWALS